MSNKFRKDAISSPIDGSASFSLDTDGNIVMWQSDYAQPSEESITSKVAELEAAEPMRLLRQDRNRLLAETDWVGKLRPHHDR